MLTLTQPFGNRRSVPSICTAAELDADGPIASPEPDWPQWNGPRRDGISREKGLLPTWPEAGPKLAWKIGNLGRGWSSPIIVRDRLYITGDVDDDLVIFAFDLDGKPLWKAKNGRSWTGSYPGARACCAYSEGKLYHMNAHGRVVCLEADTGKELWAVDVLERFQGQNITWAMSECLLVDGARVIVTPGGEKALMAALDKQSGRTVWTTEPLHEDRASHCSPLLFRHAGQRIIANCSSAHGFAVDADTGKLLWTVPLRSPYGVNVATPVYGAGRIFYVTPYVYGTCYQLQPGDGGAAAGEGLGHDLGYLHGHGAAAGRPALRQRLQKAQILALPGLEVRQDPLRVQRPDDRGGRVCRRAAVLPGRGRPGGPAAADTRTVRDRRPVSALAGEGQ